MIHNHLEQLAKLFRYFSTFNALHLEPKCHTILQYKKCGSIKESYNFIRQSSEINPQILLKARILKEAPKHNVETWWSKFNLPSNCTPSSLTRLTVVSTSLDTLTHWGRMTHICVGKLTIIGLDNGLAPRRRQAIIWTNAGLLLIRQLGTNFSKILIGIQILSFKKMHLKMSSAKWCPFCLGLNVLKSIRTWPRPDFITIAWNFEAFACIWSFSNHSMATSVYFFFNRDLRINTLVPLVRMVTLYIKDYTYHLHFAAFCLEIRTTLFIAMTS